MKKLNHHTIEAVVPNIVNEYASPKNTTILVLKTLYSGDVLNGVNNPSLNLVMKIHQAYPSINLEWLLYGTGEMGSLENNPSPNDEINDNSLFTDSEFQSAESSTNGEITKVESAPTERIRYIERPPKKIVEMRIFYDDGTFETLIPKH